MVADRRKRAKLASKGEGEDLLLAHVDEKLVVHIEKLQEVQDELEKVNEEASDKVLEVEQKYNEVRRPIYRKRKDVIQLIPDFWLTAILSHPVLGDLVTENDQKILKYLVSLDVEDFKDLKSGYSITFSFSPNPYFEDENLTKTITFTDEATASVTGSVIKWKEGMDNSNGSHQTNGTKRPFEEDSFFNWFNEAQQKTVSDGLGDEVAEIIKEDLWPNPLKYFNNETDEEDFGEEEDDDEDKGTEDEEEDDDDDDDVDEHDSNAEDD